MFYRIAYPTKDKPRKTFLETVLRMYGLDAMQGQSRLRSESAERATELLLQFQQLYETVVECQEEHGAISKDLEPRMRKLRGRLSSLWADVRTEVAADEATSALYTHYLLTQSGSPPYIGNRKACVDVASEVLAGHERARSRGEYPQLDASRVQQVYYEVQNAMVQLQSITGRKKDAQEALRPLRKSIQLLARSIAKELRSTLVHESAHYQREILRAYGFDFYRVDSNGKVIDDTLVGEGDDLDSPPIF